MNVSINNLTHSGEAACAPINALRICDENLLLISALPLCLLMTRYTNYSMNYLSYVLILAHVSISNLSVNTD